MTQGPAIAFVQAFSVNIRYGTHKSTRKHIVYEIFDVMKHRLGEIERELPLLEPIVPMVVL
ncbi:hypothetical protein [Paenibacillus tundrae]|uniref:hypothetical protein n=1 Tax=Paenibacillus tundrae TaxID=528187 RepID=UPI0022A9A698|nr:hypothetical protein [Paenibacillus tundrae]